jgi:uncharacterized membrane protein YoaK (UPF0700 family)
MPIDYARRLTTRERSARSNRHLGFTLAFVAGATNAGAFLAVQQYTSHMTGVVSAVADSLALGQWRLALAGLAALLSFVLGAALSAVMINFARRRRLSSEFALPLLLQAVLMLCFGLLGAWLAALPGLIVPATVMLLCLMMGLQNAVITKLSRAEIRTTHVTGVVTDIGIELGKLFYWNRSSRRTDVPLDELLPDVMADRQRLLTLVTLLLSFGGGGVVGALGFQRMGYLATIPLAALLVSLALVPAWDDLRRWWPGARPPS